MKYGKPKGLTYNDGLSRSQRQFTKSLQQKKYRYQHRQFLIEGIKLLNEALSARFPIGQILALKDIINEINIPSSYDPSILKIVTETDIKSVSSLKNPEGVVATAAIPDQKTLPAGDSTGSFLYLWELNDPGNLGTIVRTARWFGISTIFLSPNCVDPFSPKVVRGSMGALFHIHIHQDIQYDHLVTYANNHSFLLLAADANAPPIQSLTTNKWGLILGSESHGLPKYLQDSAVLRFGVPKKGEGESLNVSVAAGILLSQITQMLGE